MSLRQAAQRALKAMEDGEYRADMIEFSDALVALRQALAEPEQNPFGDDAERYARKLHEEREYYKALYTAPTLRKPLTDAEMPTLFVGGLALNSEATTEIVRAVEKAHGIGEQHGS